MWLNSFSDPSGFNGYFYLRQIESLGNGFQFYFKDRSLSFLLPVLIYKFTEQSLFAFQASIALVFFFTLLGLESLAKNISASQTSPAKKSWISMILIISLFCTGFHNYELEMTFYKNSFALAIFIWGMVFIFSDKLKKLGYFFFILSFFSHKSMALLIGLVLLLIHYPLLKQKKIFILLIPFFLLPFILFYEKGFDLLLSMGSFFTSPINLIHWLQEIYVLDQQMLLTLIGLILSLMASIYLLLKHNATLTKNENQYLLFFILLSIISLNPFQKTGPDFPSYRMIIICSILLIPSLNILCDLQKPLGKVIASIISLILISQITVDSRSFYGLIPTWSNYKEDIYLIKDHVTQEDHLTAHHGLEFFVDYTTNIRARSFLSNNESQKKFRLAYLETQYHRNKELMDEILKFTLVNVSGRYFMVTEENWLKLVSKYSIVPHSKNPSIYRPNHIYE
jgi:hypothetical protein